MECLAWSTGTNAIAMGEDLASVCRTLTLDQLDHWLERFQKGSLRHEASIIQAEIDLRDPKGARGTLWEAVCPIQEDPQ